MAVRKKTKLPLKKKKKAVSLKKSKADKAEKPREKTKKTCKEEGNDPGKNSQKKDFSQNISTSKETAKAEEKDCCCQKASCKEIIIKSRTS
jgi:hypothetical protein